MKVACLQMDVLPSQPDSNFRHVEELIRKAMEEKPDVLVLPESWDISFLPRSATADLYAGNFDRAIRELGALAKELNFTILGLTFSPVKGPEGNIEFLGHLTLDDKPGIEPDTQAVVTAAHTALKG